MGSIFNPPHPSAPMAPPPAAHPAVLGSAQTALSGAEQKKSADAAAGAGMSDTIKTSPQGLKAPATAKSTLLG